MNRVAITGMGVVSCIGTNVHDFWSALSRGASGTRLITLYEPAEKACRIAGQVPHFDPEDPAYGLVAKELKAMDRFTQFAVAASNEAVAHAGLNLSDEAKLSAGVLIGTGIGGIGAYEKEFSKDGDRPRMVDAFTVPKIMNNAAAGWISMKHGLRGRNQTFNTACSSAANAIGEAFRAIRRGEAEVMLCGGAEAPIAPKLMHTWNCMKVLSKHYEHPEQACRPFDKQRDGLVMAEGAGILVLESLEHAQRRGAEVLGEVIGFGCNSDAYSLTNPLQDGVAAAMQLALDDAGIKPEDIGYVNAHGTATRMNDPVESAAIRQVFGAHADMLPVSSTKAMLGHAMGASPALEAIACVLAMRDGLLPPTANLQEPDPKCDLDYIPLEPRKASVRYAMSNAFAFGGNNAVLVLQAGS